MNIELTAFGWVPKFAEGYVKDLRVRWALEEAGLPYTATLIDDNVKRSEPYLRRQPFGQVPAYRDGEVEMFESGAIVLHIAAKSEALAPKGYAGARVASWVFAALNSVEPYAQNLLQLSEADSLESWAKERREHAEAKLNERLAALATWLADKQYLEGRFPAGDLIMTTVLRELVDCGALSHFPTRDLYRQRCEARPAFRRALEAQMRPFRESAAA